MTNVEKLTLMGLGNLPSLPIKVMVSETTQMSYKDTVKEFVVNHVAESNNTGVHGLFTCQTLKMCSDFKEGIIQAHYSNDSITKLVDLTISLGIKVITRSTIQWMYSEEDIKALKKFTEYGGIFVNAGGNDINEKNEPTNVPKDYCISVGTVYDSDNSNTDVVSYTSWELPPNPSSPEPIYTHTSSATPVIAYVCACIQQLYGYNVTQMKAWIKDNSVVNTEDATERLLKIGELYLMKTIKIAIGSEFVMVNGEVIKMDTKAILDQNNRILVPVRFIANALGVDNADITYDIKTKTATIIQR